MESLQEILGFKDESGEINKGETAYIRPIWHVLRTFIIYMLVGNHS